MPGPFGAGASSAEPQRSEASQQLRQEPQPGSGEELSPLRARIVNASLVFGFGVGYIFISAGLIAFNKYLMHLDRFPFAVPLVFIHAVFCSVCAGILYLCFPKLFPSLSDPERKVTIDADLIFRGALPIALMFSGQLALSNTAYLHSSVAFLQMMKEANLALVYTMSLVMALERFNWRHCQILVLVIAATLMTIHGELNFSQQGFFIQGLSQLFECTKIVLQAMLLSNSGRKLDALTYVMLVMPLCALILGVALFPLVLWPNPHLMTPSWADLVLWSPYLFLNAGVAFCLNVVIALFIKYSSAVAFILAGMAKDAMIVCSGVFIMKEIITTLQAVGFALQLGLICLYTMTKTFPDQFEKGMLHGIGAVLFGMDSASPPQKAAATKQTPRDYGAFEEGEAPASSSKGCA